MLSLRRFPRPITASAKPVVPVLALLCLFLLASVPRAVAQPGAVDLSEGVFPQSQDERYAPIATAGIELADGKVLIAGVFDSWNGHPRPGWVRLNPDGTVDESFAPTTLLAKGSRQLLLLPDGKLLVRVNQNFNSVSSPLVRLLSDGSLDPVFDLQEPWPATYDTPVFVDRLGRLYGQVFGSQQPGDAVRPRVPVRWLPDGEVDPTFQPDLLEHFRPHFSVRDVLPLEGGDVMLVGDFVGDDFSQHRHVRLSSDGKYKPDTGLPGTLRDPVLVPDGPDGFWLLNSWPSVEGASWWSEAATNVVLTVTKLDAALRPRPDAGVSTNVFAGRSAVEGAVRLRDGSVVFWHGAAWLWRSQFQLRRLTPEGRLDESFGPVGVEKDYGPPPEAWLAAGARHLWVGLQGQNVVNGITVHGPVPLAFENISSLSSFTLAGADGSWPKDGWSIPETNAWFQFGVWRRNGLTGEATVRYEVTPLDELNRVEPQAGTLVFTNGQRLAVGAIAVRDDNVDWDARFRVRLMDAGEDVLAFPTEIEVLVKDDERYGFLRLQDTAFPAGEVETNVVITVVREGNPIWPASVRYRLGGTAVRRVDYEGEDGILHFAPGQMEASFTVRLLADELFDPFKLLEVELHDPQGGPALANYPFDSSRRRSWSVQDDESGLYLIPAAYHYAVADDRLEVNEAAGTVAIHWRRTGPGNEALRGVLTTAAGDLTVLADPGVLPRTLELAAGEQQGTWLLPLRNDGVANPPRELTLVLEAEGAPPGSRTFELRLTVHDDDGAGAPSPLFPDWNQRLSAIDPAGNWYASGTTRYLPDGELDPRWSIHPRQFPALNIQVAVPRGAGGIYGVSAPDSFGHHSVWSLNHAGGITTEAVSDHPAKRVTLYRPAYAPEPSGDLLTGDRRLTPQLQSVPLPGGGMSQSSTHALVRQPDGRFIVSGSFTSIGDRPVASLARFYPDGSLDVSFDVGSGPDGKADRLAVQADGKVLVAGSFTNFDGRPRRGLARLLPDGSLDEGFLPSGMENLAPVWVVDERGYEILKHDQILALMPLRDGRILIAGTFDNLNGQPCGHYALLSEDGQLNPGFVVSPGADAPVTAAFELPDGDVAIAGDFRNVNGSPIYGTARLKIQVRPTINFAESVFGASHLGGQLAVTLVRRGDPGPEVSVRLRVAGGSADAGAAFASLEFPVNFAAGETNRTVLLPLAGSAAYFGRRVFSLELVEPSANADLGRREARAHLYGDQPGTLDLSLRWAPDEFREVRQLTALDDGGWLAVGRAKNLPWEVLRLLSDGSVDRGWVAERPEWFVLTNGVNVAVPTQDGKVLVAGRGQFWNIGVSRINGDGSRDSSLRSPTGSNHGSISSILPLGNGGYYLGGVGGVRLQRYQQNGVPDGFRDPFSAYEDPLEPWNPVVEDVSTLARLPDGLIYGGASILSHRAWEGLWPVFRLDREGRLDRSFQPRVFGDVACFAQHGDGGVLVGGWLDEYPTYPGRFGVARILPNNNWLVSGSVETDGKVWAIAAAGDGKHWIGGEFTQVAGVRRPGLARLNPDLSVDQSWDLGEGFFGIVRALAVPPNGGLLVGGQFDLVDGVRWSGLIRLRGGSEPGRVEFATHTFNARAGDAEVPVRLRRRGGNHGPVSVRLTTHGGSAVPGVDYQPLDEAVTFADGDDAERVVRLTLLPSGGDGGAKAIGLRLAGAVPEDALGETVRAQALMQDSRLGVLPPDALPVTGSPRDATVGLADGSFITRGNQPGQLVRVLPDGRLDPQFSVAFPGADVQALAALPDGSLIIGARGDFVVRHDGGATTNLVRLRPDGSVDPGFRAPRIPDGSSLRVLPLPAGRLLVFGEKLIRLRADGTLDEGFDCPIFQPLCVAVDEQGRVLVGTGPYAVGSLNRGGIWRLRDNGQVVEPPVVDVSFSGRVEALTVQPDGRIVFAGPFQLVNGARKTSPARVWPGGAVDSTFQPPVFDGPVTHLLQASDGMLYLGGGFTRVNGTTRWLLARCLADGKLDTTFRIEPATSLPLVTALVQLPTGDLLLGCELTGVTPVRRLLRINLPPEQPTRLDFRMLSEGTRFSTIDPVRFAVAAEDPDTVIAHVELRSNGAWSVARLDEPAGELAVKFPAPGWHEVTAVATDVTGRRTVSDSFRFQVRAPGGALVNRVVRHAAGWRFEVTVEPGGTYRLERSADLNEWEAVSAVMADTEHLELEVPEAPEARQFYRVIRP